MNVRICGDCWTSFVRPTEYEPDTFVDGVCARCGQRGAVHRVALEELVDPGMVKLARRYQRHRAAAADDYEALVPMIRAARPNLSLRTIADLTGLSYARIFQITNPKEKPPA